MLTREFINKKIIYHDYFLDANQNLQSRAIVDYTQLCVLIDNYKDLISSYNIPKDTKVVIGLEPSVSQLAAIIACWELGLIIAVIDYKRIDKWNDTSYIDPKTKLLLPIDTFITFADEFKDTIDGRAKYVLFSNLCKNVVNINKATQINTSQTPACLPKDNAIICTSSGTTGTPKIILHTHEFLYNLAKRNSTMYYGKVGLSENLNHGSSLATFFLPSLCSENVTDFYFVYGGIYKFAKHFELDHLMISYSHLVDAFLKGISQSLPKLNLYTLSLIKQEWLSYFKSNQIKDIVSIFGSNETSGPVFLNTISQPKFAPHKFFAMDDFYNINLGSDGELEVTLPIYNKVIKTNDTFTFKDNSFYHKGRNDLLRINGKDIPLEDYYEKVKQLLDADIVYDTLNQQIYLAIWGKNTSDVNVDSLKSFLKNKSNGSHTIDKHQVLDKEKFLTGIKLDQELLRDYFRNFVQ